MNYRTGFYSLLTVLLIGLGSVLAYHMIRRDEHSLDRNSLPLHFLRSLGCGDELTELKQKRRFTSYHLGIDTTINALTLMKIRKELHALKNACDSVHGIRIVMSDDTPYRFYLKAVEICMEQKPKYFIPNDRELYAIAKRRHQMRDDSLTDEANAEMEKMYRNIRFSDTAMQSL